MGRHLCFTEESQLDYGICREVGCPLTPPGEMVRRLLCYRLSSKYSAVGDISYVAESVILGDRRRLDGERMGLK